VPALVSARNVCAVTAAEPGLLVVDKPSGLTSHDVVALVRRTLGTRAVGHAGTLDPMATGVLVLGVGRATRLLGHLALHDKTYLATIRLGVATTTDDAQGEPLSVGDASAVPEADIRARMSALIGRIQQVPSTVSAVKIGGERAYRMARRGEDPALTARPVTVSRFELHALRRGEAVTDLDVLVECSTGTYVRALARDLGAALGVGGHLTALRRTRVGPFGLDTAVTLEELEADPRVTLPLDTAVATAFTTRRVDDAGAAGLSHGRPLPAAGIEGNYGVLDPQGRAIALVAERDGQARPIVVLRPAGQI
jgi:tRNA pseudouridine55 synthase